MLKPRGQLCLQPNAYNWHIYTYNSRLNTFTGHKLLSTRKLLTQTDNSKLRLEAFAETDFNEIFSGRQPCQDVKFCRHSTEPPVHPEDGDGVSSETSENLHILTRLSAQKYSMNSKLRCSNIFFFFRICSGDYCSSRLPTPELIFISTQIIHQSWIARGLERKILNDTWSTAFHSSLSSV